MPSLGLSKALFIIAMGATVVAIGFQGVGLGTNEWSVFSFETDYGYYGKIAVKIGLFRMCGYADSLYLRECTDIGNNPSTALTTRALEISGVAVLGGALGFAVLYVVLAAAFKKCLKIQLISAVLSLVAGILIVTGLVLWRCKSIEEYQKLIEYTSGSDFSNFRVKYGYSQAMSILAGALSFLSAAFFFGGSRHPMEADDGSMRRDGFQIFDKYPSKIPIHPQQTKTTYMINGGLPYSSFI